MRIFKNIQDASDLRRLRRRAQHDPSPLAIADLCRKLQRQGRAGAALVCAQEGLDRFPHSLELRDILRATWKRESVQHIRDLEARIAASPAVDTYRDLVEFYLYYDEVEYAEAAVKRMAEALKESAETALLHARVYLIRFHRDHVAADGSAGLRWLHRAAEFDGKSLEAQLGLAETYAYIGSISKALFHVYKVLDLDPTHLGAKRLYEKLVKLPLEREEESVLLRTIEESDKGTFEWIFGRAERDPDPPKSLVAELERITGLAGVRRIAVNVLGMSRVASGGRSRDVSPGDDRFFDLSDGFRRAASLSSKRIGIGAICEAELRWKEGTILALTAGSSIILLESGEEAGLTQIRSAASSFIAACAPAAKE